MRYGFKYVVVVVCFIIAIAMIAILGWPSDKKQTERILSAKEAQQIEDDLLSMKADNCLLESTPYGYKCTELAKPNKVWMVVIK